MKRKLVIAFCILACGTLTAQTNMPTSDQLMRHKMQTMHKRDASQSYKAQKYTLSEYTPKETKGTKTSKGTVQQMPEGAWFPGEWEEVKAIVVTCYNNYLVPGHENDGYWYANPVVTGYADYYHGYNDTQTGGPYIAVPDTSNTTFSNVFFYLMDAIQMGGAEAWVRIENAKDSNSIIRKLDNMGLRHDNMRFIIGPGNSFWFRDCGPICFYYGDQDSVGMVDFEYYPGRALDDSLPSLIEAQMGIPNFITQIEWEGGNCVVDGAGMVLSSDKIYNTNADTRGQVTWDGSNPETIHTIVKGPLSEAQVKDSLAHIMGPRGAHILPHFRFDGGTGHLDLYCEMVDENEFVFSKFPDHYSSWYDYKVAKKNIDTLMNYESVFGNNFKCHYIPFPCMNNGGNFANQTTYNDSYTRTYSNHTFVNNVIIQPCFSNVVNGQPSKEWDRLRIDSLRAAYPGYTIYPINVASFDGSGGAIHCITKQIPADNPIRILHPSITGNTEQTYNTANAPIEAYISNRSGIASATLYYSFDGQPMQAVTMTADASDPTHFTASIPTAGQLTANSKRVDYYISATSNNGKTITKPMTAANGGYYTFWLGHHDPVSINAVESQIVSLYPNPANSTVNIQGSNEWKEVRVVDLMGRVVLQKEFEGNATSLDVSTLPQGLYFVVLKNERGKVVKKMAIEK